MNIFGSVSQMMPSLAAHESCRSPETPISQAPCKWRFLQWKPPASIASFQHDAMFSGKYTACTPCRRFTSISSGHPSRTILGVVLVNVLHELGMPCQWTRDSGMLSEVSRLVCYRLWTACCFVSQASPSSIH